MKYFSEYMTQLPWDPRDRAVMAAHRADEQRLRAEFFVDARAELGYAELLTEEACQEVEALAWRDRHGSGYADVFYALRDLAELVKQLAQPNKWRTRKMERT